MFARVASGEREDLENRGSCFHPYSYHFLIISIYFLLLPSRQTDKNNQDTPPTHLDTQHRLHLVTSHLNTRRDNVFPKQSQAAPDKLLSGEEEQKTDPCFDGLTTTERVHIYICTLDNYFHTFFVLFIYLIRCFHFLHCSSFSMPVPHSFRCN